MGGELGDEGKIEQGSEGGKDWEVTMEEERLARVQEAWWCPKPLKLHFAWGDGFRCHGVFWVNLGVIFIPDEMVLTVSKQVINTGSNCSKPIIKDNMELWSDGSSVQVEYQRESACMIWA